MSAQRREAVNDLEASYSANFDDIRELREDLQQLLRQDSSLATSFMGSTQSSSEARSREKSLKPKVAALSKRLRNSGAVEDRLLSMHQSYEKRLEKGRKQKEDEEMAELRGVPEIDAKSRKLSANRQRGSNDLAVRLMEFGELHRQKMETLSKRKDDAELRMVTGQPQIHPWSKSLVRPMPVEDFLYSWADEKEQKLEEMRAAKEQKELQDIKPQPKICRMSSQIASNLVRSGPVWDRLQYLAAVSNYRKQEMQRRKEQFDREEANPVISMHSAQLARSGRAHERLYQQAYSLRDKKERAILSKTATEEVDPVTGQKLFHPMVTTLALSKATRRNGQDIGESLYSQGLDLLHRRQRISERKLEEMRRLAGAPKMSSYSEVLVRLLEKRMQVNHMDRLLVPYRPQRISSRRKDKDIQEREQDLTFRPHINDLSHALDEQMHGRVKNPNLRARLMLQKAERIKQRILHLQQAKERQELSECTFRPHISSEHAPETYIPMLDRMEEEQSRRQQRLEAERLAKEDIETLECTFHPNISISARSIQYPSDAQYARPTQSMMAKRNGLVLQVPPPRNISMMMGARRSNGEYGSPENNNNNSNSNQQRPSYRLGRSSSSPSPVNRSSASSVSPPSSSSRPRANPVKSSSSSPGQTPPLQRPVSAVASHHPSHPSSGIVNPPSPPPRRPASASASSTPHTTSPSPAPTTTNTEAGARSGNVSRSTVHWDDSSPTGTSTPYAATATGKLFKQRHTVLGAVAGTLKDNQPSPQLPFAARSLGSSMNIPHSISPDISPHNGNGSGSPQHNPNSSSPSPSTKTIRRPNNETNGPTTHRQNDNNIRASSPSSYPTKTRPSYGSAADSFPRTHRASSALSMIVPESVLRNRHMDIEHIQNPSSRNSVLNENNNNFSDMETLQALAAKFNRMDGSILSRAFAEPPPPDELTTSQKRREIGEPQKLVSSASAVSVSSPSPSMIRKTRPTSTSQWAPPENDSDADDLVVGDANWLIGRGR